MSKIDELIERLCPNGVRFEELKNKKLFKFYYGKGNRIPEDIGGIYDVYGANGIVSHINEYNCEDVTIIGHIGAVGMVNRCKKKCFVTYNGTIAEVVDKTMVNSQYLYYVLTTLNLPSYKKGSQPFLSVSDFDKIRIPVPPLEVQCEIVHILDDFTLLSAELSAELKARKEQFNYYRDELIKTAHGAKYKTLSEIATDMYRGSGIKRDEVTETGIPCVRYGEIYTTYNVLFDSCASYTDEAKQKSKKYFEYGDVLFAITGESVEEIGKSTVYLGKEKCLAGGDIVVMKHNENPK